ncbi:hypothetical protein HMPREF1871_00853 [Gemelliphila asaccharolytica]|uniref:Uncharacterized protein n=1 Tax=Gemelliphila asaccharolytica TaxID=502393 RepID=A0ABR5TLD6_9BACL|nr:hypothetical protein HMPREF1871_00853 [Gemella asaccharolytica]
MFDDDILKKREAIFSCSSFYLVYFTHAPLPSTMYPSGVVVFVSMLPFEAT